MANMRKMQPDKHYATLRSQGQLVRFQISDPPGERLQLNWDGIIAIHIETYEMGPRAERHYIHTLYATPRGYRVHIERNIYVRGRIRAGETESWLANHDDPYKRDHDNLGGTVMTQEQISRVFPGLAANAGIEIPIELDTSPERVTRPDLEIPIEFDY